jgi:hypothetical protein
MAPTRSRQLSANPAIGAAIPLLTHRFPHQHYDLLSREASGHSRIERLMSSEELRL